MRTPEGLMRELLGHCEEVEAAEGGAWCRTHRVTLDGYVCPTADGALALIRARDAEVAEQVRAEVLAAATWEFRMGGRQQRFRLIGPWEPVEP